MELFLTSWHCTSAASLLPSCSGSAASDGWSIWYRARAEYRFIALGLDISVSLIFASVGMDQMHMLVQSCPHARTHAGARARYALVKNTYLINTTSRSMRTPWDTNMHARYIVILVS